MSSRLAEAVRQNLHCLTDGCRAGRGGKGLVRPVVEMLLAVVIPERRHGRSIDVSRGESGGAQGGCKMPPPSRPIPSHRPPARK